MTISWNEVTIFWNEVTVRWNEMTWKEVTMERSDRNSLFKRQSVSFEELSADSCPRGRLMFLKQIFAQEAKLQGKIY